MITIFTATYNRQDTIPRLYESLKKQEYKNFEWLIIDDGSTDNTCEIIEKYKKEEAIKIRYYKVKNGGKQKAFNLALEKVEGDYFICIDSDDYLADNILVKVNYYIQKVKDMEDVAGIGFLVKKHEKEEIVGTEFPKDEMIDTYANIYNKHKVKGDKQLIFKTEIIKKYPFPIVDDEKFIAEATVFNRISKKYKMLFVNTTLTYVEYRVDGYSANYFNLIKKNPKSNMLYLKELYEFEPTLYNIAAYDLFGIYAKIKIFDIIKSHPSKFKALIMYLPAYIKYMQKERKK